jgi:hypothetical protein
MCNTDSTKKKRRWTEMLVKGKQFLLLIRHPPCYSYRQSTPVKVLTVIEEKKDPLLFEIWLFCNGQPHCDDDGRIFVAMTSTNVKVKVRSRFWVSVVSLTSSSYHRCDVDNHRIENCSVTEHHLYNRRWNQRSGLIFYLYSWKPLKEFCINSM